MCYTVGVSRGGERRATRPGARLFTISQNPPYANSFGINTSASTDSTPLKVHQNQHLQKTGEGVSPPSLKVLQLVTIYASRNLSRSTSRNFNPHYCCARRSKSPVSPRILRRPAPSPPKPTRRKVGVYSQPAGGQNESPPSVFHKKLPRRIGATQPSPLTFAGWSTQHAGLQTSGTAAFDYHPAG